jgi:hypothetical protein
VTSSLSSIHSSSYAHLQRKQANVTAMIQSPTRALAKLRTSLMILKIPKIARKRVKCHRISRQDLQDRRQDPCHPLSGKKLEVSCCHRPLTTDQRPAMVATLRSSKYWTAYKLYRRRRKRSSKPWNRTAAGLRHILAS